jgi:hypothetical protein
MTQNTEQLLTDLTDAFNPFHPLPAGDPQYVDCQEVRGDDNITLDLGRNIQRSKQMTYQYQLYAGHRGAGKSTELLRLEDHLKKQGYFVVYFAADEQDINPEDTEYTDILLACTRHFLEAIKDADPKPLRDWMESRWNDLKDLALSEVSFETLNLEMQISQFAKLTANVRNEPSLRQKIREKVNPYTLTLIDALNEFIVNAKNKLPSKYSKLVVIADNLDRIVPFSKDPGGRSNLDEIFLDRSEQLKALKCHVVYTVPISMVHSNRAADLSNNYSNPPQVLPMIMVRKPSGEVHPPGLAKMKELIEKRVKQVDPHLSLETDFFDTAETLERLCLMSGGHVRNLMLMMQEAIKKTDNLPITAKAAKRAIANLRDVYRKTAGQNEWSILAQVSLSRRILNDEQHRNLLFSRCILEYRYLDEEEDIQSWYDVHPLIKGIPEFKEAVAILQS